MSAERRKWEHLIDKRIRIDCMVDEPQYTGREGVVEIVDDWGQLHGTWGGLAVQPDRDKITILD